ncbi:hypothetical protein D918_00848 [Trichuris suis]|nr:hypothetical protein D918_00848 [Trichuris suis]
MATRTTGNFIIEEWRDLWSFKSDFIIVCFVYVFSSTSILALPKMFIENGGGAFGVAYLISLLVCCTPLVMMELAVGQLCASSPPKSMFNMSPLFAEQRAPLQKKPAGTYHQCHGCGGGGFVCFCSYEQQTGTSTTASLPHVSNMRARAQVKKPYCVFSPRTDQPTCNRAKQTLPSDFIALV